MSQKKLLLIDGYAGLYRAFYGIKSLTTRDGTPTNAVYGFVRMLNQLKLLWAPTHWAVIFDGGLPEERTVALPEYKAQRSPMPDDLRSQIDLLERYLDAASIVNVCVDGQEADDVLATYACRAVEKSFEVMIGTSDKDLFQVVGDGVSIVPLAGKTGKMRSDEVEAKTGVKPAMIVEWLALVGDSADNIPGVPGIGVKTAAKLLNQFGSIEAMLNDLEKVDREKIRCSLDESRDIIERNIGVVRLNTELNVEPDVDDLILAQPDVRKMISILDELEFEAMAKEYREPDLFG